MEARMARQGAALLTCLFLACGILVDAQLTGVYDSAENNIRSIDFARSSFNLTCKVDGSVLPNTVVEWFKDNVPVSNSSIKDRYNVAKTGNMAVLTIKPIDQNDNGTYSCKLKDQQPEVSATFRVTGKPHVRLADNVNVVEGQTIKIICNVLGKPNPELTWTTDRDGKSNVTIEADDEKRVNLTKNEEGVENAVLVLSEAQPSDAGGYYCRATQPASNQSHIAGTTLRVKDKLAALWPFIGIVIEVLVLCAVILVYEKRRSKGGDMEDSDTDNHDQKKS